MSPWPRLVTGLGGGFLLVAVAQSLLVLEDGGSLPEAVVGFVLLASPAAVFLYVGRWLPRAGIDRVHYPRIVAWSLGGVVTMFAFLGLRDLHPGVTVEWTLGTQVIALALGSIGGLLVGVNEAQAATRTEQLERRNRQLTERERDLEQQNDRLAAFASIVSHDLRNPLTVAKGRLELARDERDSEDLAALATSLARMDALIEDLLTLARDGEAVQDAEPVDLRELVETCWRHVETPGASLSVRTDRTVRGDRGRLQRLFENLFRNAMEHGAADGRPPRDAAAPGSQPARDGGRALAITVGELSDGFYVEDDGSGIPEDERGRVFESGYTTSQDGTGLGLAIVRGTVDAHGWTVTATEGPDGGARFEVTGVEFED